MVNVQFNSKEPPSECYSSEMAEMVVKFCFIKSRIRWRRLFDNDILQQAYLNKRTSHGFL